MPGSPPIKVAEPGDEAAAGDPVEFANSGDDPRLRRGGAERSSSGKGRPVAPRRAASPPTPSAAASSMMAFHSPQESHLPCQRWLIAPQFWQT